MTPGDICALLDALAASEARAARRGDEVMDCEHLYSSEYCDRCDKYTGQVCEFCGDFYDGGDHMASQSNIWCECEPEARRTAEDDTP